MAQEQVDVLLKLREELKGELESVKKKLEEKHRELREATRNKEPREVIDVIRRERDELIEDKNDLRQQQSTLLAQLAGRAGQAVALQCPRQRNFQACGAAHPSSNFWVEPKIMSGLVTAILDGRLIMVIAPRQFGKTSVAQRLGDLVEGKVVNTAWSNTGRASLAVLRVCLSQDTPLDPAGFLRWFHLCLQENDPDGISQPSNVTVGETVGTARGDLLEAMRSHGSAPNAYAILIDEAGFLAGQHIKGNEERRQAYATVRCLLNILKDEFRDKKTRYVVHSVTLLGVDSLRRLLHDTNRGIQQQQPRASSSASAMDVEASSPSDSSSRWTNISPFSEHNLFELDNFSWEQIADLLTQYREQHQKVYMHPLQLDVQDLAQIIHKRTGGFPGLVGLCCSEISSKLISNPADWYQWCGTDLVHRVQQQRNYSVITNTVAFLLASGKWQRLRVVLRDLLLYNSCVAKRAERRTIVEMLLSDGIATVVSSNEENIQLQVRCPLLRDVMLAEARFGLASCPVPPDPTTLDMAWVLREAFKRIDMRNIQAPAAGTKSKPFSEYVWHGELFPLIKAIAYKAYPSLCYRAVTEARELKSAAHHMKRIDLVMTDRNRLPAHGVEALICGSVGDVKEHYMRAANIYQPLYSQHSDEGMALPSTIQVVNICTEEEAGTGHDWQPEPDERHMHVKMVHVKLCKDYTEAHVTWSDRAHEVLTVTSAAHGQLEFYAPREL